MEASVSIQMQHFGHCADERLNPSPTHWAQRSWNCPELPWNQQTHSAVFKHTCSNYWCPKEPIVTKISLMWQTCRNWREKETRTPLLESRAGKICFCQTDFECPYFRVLGSCISSKGRESTTSSLYIAWMSWKIYGGSTPKIYTLCLGCSSTTHIVLAVIHYVHVATIRVWQWKAQSICTFLPGKHEAPLSLTAEQQ